MTRYEQQPAGWWQDSKGRAQPPGSFADSSLRTTGESGRSASPHSATGLLRRLMRGHRRRAS